MKKKAIKIVGITTMILSIAVLPACAQNFKGNKEQGKHQNMQNNQFQPSQKKNGRMMEFDLIGKVIKVDNENQVIFIIDVDGKEQAVHVNDFTRISTVQDKPCALDEKETEPSQKTTNGTKPVNGEKPENFVCPEQKTINDIQKDSSIAVKFFDTDTKIKEAKNIIFSEK